MELTRVVCKTLPKREKSLTPESRTEILEESRAFVDRKDETHEDREFAIVRQLEKRKRGALHVLAR